MQLNLKEKLNQYDVTSLSEFVEFVYNILDPKINPIYNKRNFNFDMLSFGTLKYKNLSCESVCFGCMATASVISLTDIDPVDFLELRQDMFSPSNYNQHHELSILLYFERAVDAVRIHHYRDVSVHLMDLCSFSVWDNMNIDKLKRFINNHDRYLEKCHDKTSKIQEKVDLLNMYTNNSIQDIIKSLEYYETTEF